MNHLIDTYTQTRRLIRRLVTSLPPEQLAITPPGFDNNILWNFGHIITVQQSLVYRLSNLPTATTRAQNALFKPGSAPADWETTPDFASLLALFDETTAQLGPDVANGRFVTFNEYTTTTGVRLTSVKQALAFNLYHEGLHTGTMLSLRNQI